MAFARNRTFFNKHFLICVFFFAEPIFNCNISSKMNECNTQMKGTTIHCFVHKLGLLQFAFSQIKIELNCRINLRKLIIIAQHENYYLLICYIIFYMNEKTT